ARLGAGAAFGAMFYGTFGCMHPLAAAHGLAVQAEVLLSFLFGSRIGGDPTAISIVGHALTGAVLGLAAAAHLAHAVCQSAETLTHPQFPLRLFWRPARTTGDPPAHE